MASKNSFEANLPDGVDREFLSAPKPARRRMRESLPPGTNMTVLDPELKHVFCMETGEVLPVQQVIGSDYVALVKLRMPYH